MGNGKKRVNFEALYADMDIARKNLGTDIQSYYVVKGVKKQREIPIPYDDIAERYPLGEVDQAGINQIKGRKKEEKRIKEKIEAEIAAEKERIEAEKARAEAEKRNQIKDDPPATKDDTNQGAGITSQTSQGGNTQQG